MNMPGFNAESSLYMTNEKYPNIDGSKCPWITYKGRSTATVADRRVIKIPDQCLRNCYDRECGECWINYVMCTQPPFP